MKPLSKLVNIALDEITNGEFINLPKLAIMGLLNDFQYSWLQRFNIPYKFVVLDMARNLCNGENKKLFCATRCKNIESIREKFSTHINRWHKTDDRVILSLVFDGKKINAEWIEMDKYLESNKTNSTG